MAGGTVMVVTWYHLGPAMLENRDGSGDDTQNRGGHCAAASWPCSILAFQKEMGCGKRAQNNAFDQLCGQLSYSAQL